MPLRTLLQGTTGDRSDDNTYADVCDELLASGALSPVDDDILLEDPLERGRSRVELAEFIEAELYNNNRQNDNANSNNALKRSTETRTSNDGGSISAGTHPSTSKRSNHSINDSGDQQRQRRDSDDSSQRSHSNRSNAGSTKEENTNNNTSSKTTTGTQHQKKGGHKKTHSFALLEDLSHQQPNYYTLGPILDDSAMRYVEMNPSYSKFDDLEYAPVNPSLMVGEFNNMGRNAYNRQQQTQQEGARNTQVDILKQQRQYNNVNTNTSSTDNFGGPHQQQQQRLPPQAPQSGVVYQQQQQQQHQHHHQQQQQQQAGMVQQEFTSVHRTGVAGPPPGNISWSHMPPQPGHPNYQHMQQPPPHQQQYQMQQGSLQPQQQQPGIPPTQAQMTRLDRLRRWKEKRKNRVFTKSIRYMSRKVCADNRPRIKGKFVKVSSLSSLTDIAENKDGEEKEKEKEEEGKNSKPDDGKGEPREKAKSEEADDLIRDLREKAIEAGLGAGKPLSGLRRNNAHASAPNLASLGDMS